MQRLTTQDYNTRMAQLTYYCMRTTNNRREKMRTSCKVYRMRFTRNMILKCPVLNQNQWPSWWRTLRTKCVLDNDVLEQYLRFNYLGSAGSRYWKKTITLVEQSDGIRHRGMRSWTFYGHRNTGFNVWQWNMDASAKRNAKINPYEKKYLIPFTGCNFRDHVINKNIGKDLMTSPVLEVMMFNAHARERRTAVGRIARVCTGYDSVRGV